MEREIYLIKQGLESLKSIVNSLAIKVKELESKPKSKKKKE